MRICPDISVTSEIEELPRLKAIIRRATAKECLELFRSVRPIADTTTPISSSDHLDKMVRNREKRVETRILRSAEYRRWKGTDAAAGKASYGAWTGLAAKLGIPGYSPFKHAWWLEEAKVAAPIALKYLAGMTDLWFGISLGFAALIFMILHIFNERLPQSRRAIPGWFFRVFTAPALVAISGTYIAFYLPSSPFTAILSSMIVHLGVNTGVLLFNLLHNVFVKGMPMRKAWSLALLGSPFSYAAFGGTDAIVERAIFDIRQWKEANQNSLNQRGTNPFSTKLQEKALEVYNTYRLDQLPFEARIRFSMEVFDEKNFASTHHLINVVLSRLSVDRQSIASVLSPADYHKTANLLSGLYNTYSIEDNKNVRFAFNWILFDFFPKEKRVIELQWLVEEIENELAKPGSGKLPTIAVLQDMHGGAKRAAPLVGFSLGLDSDKCAKVRNVDDLKNAIAEAGIGIRNKDIRLIGLTDKYDRGEDPVGTFELVSWLNSIHKAKPFIGNHDFWRTMAVLGVDVLCDEDRTRKTELRKVLFEDLAVDYRSKEEKNHHIGSWAHEAFHHAGWGDIELDQINENRFNAEIKRVNKELGLNKQPLLDGIDLAQARKNTDAELKKLKKLNAKIRSDNELHKDEPGYVRQDELPLPDVFTNTLICLKAEIEKRNAEIARVNAENGLDIKKVDFNVVTLDNYREDREVIERTLWELRDFRLFYVDIFGNLHLHNVVPFDFENKKIDVTYKGVSGFAALELMQEDVRIFFEDMDTIPDSSAFRNRMWEELGEAFTIINSWYSDKTAAAKAVAVKKFIEAGGPEGFGSSIFGYPVEEFSPRPIYGFMILGHNERKKFDEPETALPYIIPSPETGSGVILVDYEMSEGYSNRGAILTFFKRDATGKITGMRLWGYDTPDATEITDLTFKDIRGLNKDQGRFLKTLASGTSFMEWYREKALKEISSLSDALIREARQKDRGTKEAYLTIIKREADAKLNRQGERTGRPNEGRLEITELAGIAGTVGVGIAVAAACGINVYPILASIFGLAAVAAAVYGAAKLAVSIPAISGAQKGYDLDEKAARALEQMRKDPALRNVYNAAIYLLNNGTKNVANVLKKVFSRSGEYVEEFLGELVEARGLQEGIKYSKVLELSVLRYGPEMDCILEVNRAKYGDNFYGGYELEDGIYLVESKTGDRSGNLSAVVDNAMEDKIRKYELNAAKMSKEGCKIKGIIFAVGGDIVSNHNIKKFYLKEEEPDTVLELLNSKRHSHIGIFSACIPQTVVKNIYGGLTPKEKAFVDDFAADLLGRGKIAAADIGRVRKILEDTVTARGKGGTRLEIMNALKESGAAIISQEPKTPEVWGKAFDVLARKWGKSETEQLAREPFFGFKEKLALLPGVLLGAGAGAAFVMANLEYGIVDAALSAILAVFVVGPGTFGLWLALVYGIVKLLAPQDLFKPANLPTGLPDMTKKIDDMQIENDRLANRLKELSAAGLMLPSTRRVGEWLFAPITAPGMLREMLIGFLAGPLEFLRTFTRSFLDDHRSAIDYTSPQTPEERAKRKTGLILIYAAMAGAV
ncbi:MAG: hypothetical protein PHN63_04880, partial [Candidatus Omnitrophica bacterium]|nr:hypothetical protein [Candidatus Omnitrophota bacterium]